jgi:hypothetical protein
VAEAGANVDVAAPFLVMDPGRIRQRGSHRHVSEQLPARPRNTGPPTPTAPGWPGPTSPLQSRSVRHCALPWRHGHAPSDRRPEKLRHNRNPFRSVIRKNCVSHFSLHGGFTMPVPLTSPAQPRRRWPLGRIAVVFALACAVTAFTGTTALAAAAAAQSNPGLTAAASVAGSPSVAGSTTDGCSVTVSNITQETLNGEAVVTFTGQVECDSSATQIYLHTGLYNCAGVQPRESHDFLEANCGNKTNAETYTPEESRVTYTISDETAAGSGYYAPVLSFIINGTTDSGPIYGTPVHCSNGSCTNTTYAS